MAESMGKSSMLRVLMLYLGIGVILASVIGMILVNMEWNFIYFIPIYIYNLIGGIILVVMAIIVYRLKEYAMWMDIIIPIVYLVIIYPLLWFPFYSLNYILGIIGIIIDIVIVIVAILAVISLIKSLMIIKIQ